MSKKDIDFTKISMPADEFDAMMRQALDAAPPVEESARASKRTGRDVKAGKVKVARTAKAR